MKKTGYFLICLLLIAGCDHTNNNYEFEYDIVITDSAKNMTGLNSRYDDYNSDLPYRHQLMDIYFSSNRKSKGTNFDVIQGWLQFSYHSEDDILDLTIPVDNLPQWRDLMLDNVNTEKDELGPFTCYSGEDMLFMYGTEENDQFVIKYIEYTNFNTSKESVLSDPLELTGINNSGNNLYPSTGGLNKKELFFCSDRNDTTFSIYSAIYNDEIGRQSLSDGDIGTLSKIEVLSGPFDDKCPYVKDDFMVFSSNREEGYGGYDLYYSRYENSSWSEPVLFGDGVNSEYDEYRPVIFDMLGYELMIFSSNRPGGEGGFDLYIVKI